MRMLRMMLAVGLCTSTTIATADDTKKPTTTNNTKTEQTDRVDKTKMEKPDKVSQQSTDSSDATSPKLDTAAVMKLTQQAVTHIAAAQTALANGNKASAKSALAKSEQALKKLYDTPAMVAMLNEIDEALTTIRKNTTKDGTKTDTKTATETVRPLDLAPITAQMRTYRSYMDPAIAAGLERAQQRAQGNALKGAEEELRLVRDRVAVDVALLPVEEAYVRVLAAERALSNNDTKGAQRLLGGVPLVVSEVQISRPLVPVRFKLQAAAEAAESGKWDRARALVKEVQTDVAQIENAAKDSTFKSEITAFGDKVDDMAQKLNTNNRPKANEIRELATRSRSIIDEDRG